MTLGELIRRLHYPDDVIDPRDVLDKEVLFCTSSGDYEELEEIYLQDDTVYIDIGLTFKEYT